MDSSNHKDVDFYAFGSNGSGQLGIAHQEDVYTPEALIYESGMEDSITARANIGAKTIACGGNHAVMLLLDGSLLTTGDNSDGKCLGQMDGRCDAWHRQTQLPQVKYVAATWSATFFVLADDLNQVFVVGSGNSGELGLGQDITITSGVASMYLPAGLEIVQMAAGMGHLLVVTDRGEVWGWGKGRNGQLGTPAENVWSPRKIEGVPWPAAHLVCGKDFTCIFSEPSEQECLVLGLDRIDRFGVKANTPSKIPHWKQLGASWGSVFVLSDSGQLTGWGRNDHGQLPPPHLPPLQAFAAGSEHCLGLTLDGKVLAWGWGEHGNCGEHTDKDGDVKGRYNKIDMPRSACAVFAGCATSFIVTEKQDASAVK